jgi:phytoene synthase
VLEGGKVIDFSNVKASDRAEVALRRAREKLLNQNTPERGSRGESEGGGLKVNGDHSSVTGASHLAGNPASAMALSSSSLSSSATSILGINRDVVELVGHELGTFATSNEIQECASYLRSKAPSGLLESTSSLPTSAPSISAAQLTRYQEILDRAYYEAGEVTSAFAKTFYMGTMLLPPKAREAIWAVYVWCRRTDEIVDAPRDKNDGDEKMLLDLSAWELRLENLFRQGTVVDVYDLCLLDCRIKYPTMNIIPYMDMIRGMLMDVPGIGQDRYDKFDELHLYCYRVAGTVGLMSLPIFGCAPGFDDETARYGVSIYVSRWKRNRQ